ncbi:hypothetical protein R6Q59_036206 [Mikania micrantha]
MKNLLKTPNFDGLPSLQNLILKECPKLKEIHPSLENHTSLQYVSVWRCKKLRMFPTITHMKNLKNLYIAWCPKILEFPKIHANMESLVELTIEYTGIEVLPSSIGERLFNKVEIPSSIIELSNLQELVLSYNDFSRLGFSLSHLTQLKFLNVSGCKKLLELPELPSSLTILIVDGCKSLATFGDCHKNCRWLCHVSIWGGSIIKDGDRLLESMLEACMAIENHSMFLRLKGIQIAKGFTSDLVRGDRCRLQLPENWCNEFSGFLKCGVVFYDSVRISIRISKDEEINGMDSEDDVFNWEDTDTHNKYGSWMAYVSFGMLRQTAWWDQTCKALTFETHGRGFGVRLIDKKSTSAPTEMSTSFNSGYMPNFEIEHDFPYAIDISFFPQERPNGFGAPRRTKATQGLKTDDFFCNICLNCRIFASTRAVNPIFVSCLAFDLSRVHICRSSTSFL